MEKLKFRRQFLLTPTECEELKEWQIENVNNHILYVHPDCKLEKAIGKNELFLVGYFVDPHNPNRKSIDILIDIAKEYDIEKYPRLLFSLVGRFVLIIKQDNDFIFFNDACGLKTLYYSTEGNNVYAASQPLLLGKVLTLQKTEAYSEYFNSNHVKNNIEYWLPSGLSLYQNIFHLVPNHYFRVSHNSQTRFYPNKTLSKRKYSDSLNEFSTLLKKIVTTAHKQMDLTFTLTAGWESRMILSCCKDIKDDITFYTLRYRNYDNQHPDIKIPKILSKSLKLRYDILDCQKDMSDEFSDIYKLNTDMAHNDWGKIAYGMLETYPQDKITVKGNCSEIGLCCYYPAGKHKKNLSEKDMIKLVKGWSELSFIKNQINFWFDDIKEIRNYGYSIYDFFYWEQRMGSWQGQSQLEWDVVQEVFTPFNSRELLDLMLSINTKYRKKYNSILYKDTMNLLWKDVLTEPINPLSFNKRLRKEMIGILDEMRLKALFKKVLKKN